MGFDKFNGKVKKIMFEERKKREKMMKEGKAPAHIPKSMAHLPIPAPPQFRWDGRKTRAAQCVAMGWETDRICKASSCTPTQLRHWKDRKPFKDRVQEHKDAFRERVMQQGIAIRERRMDTYNKDWEATEEILRARGEDLASIPGGKTGFITYDYKGVDGHEVATFDAALFRERRLIREQVAKELGQWDEKTNDPVAPQTITICYVDATKPSVDVQPAIEAGYSQEDDSASKQ